MQIRLYTYGELYKIISLAFFASLWVSQIADTIPCCTYGTTIHCISVQQWSPGVHLESQVYQVSFMIYT